NVSQRQLATHRESRLRESQRLVAGLDHAGSGRPARAEDARRNARAFVASAARCDDAHANSVARALPQPLAHGGSRGFFQVRVDPRLPSWATCEALRKYSYTPSAT